MSEQNFKNHAQLVPPYHYGTLVVLLLTIIGAVINLFGVWGTDNQYDASLITVLAVAGFMGALYGRIFALKAQDRAIRAEENMRNYVRKGTLLDPRLTIQQIIALRFAPDEEYDALAARAIENGMSQKDIKQAIKNWKADTYRV
jgi:hypothetical protein